MRLHHAHILPAICFCPFCPSMTIYSLSTLILHLWPQSWRKQPPWHTIYCCLLLGSALKGHKQDVVLLHVTTSPGSQMSISYSPIPCLRLPYFPCALRQALCSGVQDLNRPFPKARVPGGFVTCLPSCMYCWGCCRSSMTRLPVLLSCRAPLSLLFCSLPRPQSILVFLN